MLRTRNARALTSRCRCAPLMSARSTIPRNRTVFMRDFCILLACRFLMYSHSTCRIGVGRCPDGFPPCRIVAIGFPLSRSTLLRCGAPYCYLCESKHDPSLCSLAGGETGPIWRLGPTQSPSSRIGTQQGSTLRSRCWNDSNASDSSFCRLFRC